MRQVDRPLTGRGRKQVEDARPYVAALNISAVFYSPLVRTVETAAIIANGLSRRLIAEPDLKEACLGDKKGRLESNPEDDFVARWFGGQELANSESYLVFRKRVVGGVNRCLVVKI